MSPPNLHRNGSRDQWRFTASIRFVPVTSTVTRFAVPSQGLSSVPFAQACRGVAVSKEGGLQAHVGGGVHASVVGGFARPALMQLTSSTVCL